MMIKKGFIEEVIEEKIGNKVYKFLRLNNRALIKHFPCQFCKLSVGFSVPLCIKLKDPRNNENDCKHFLNFCKQIDEQNRRKGDSGDVMSLMPVF